MSLITKLEPRTPPIATAVPARVFDVHRLRRDFPILKQKVHGKPLVYLDSAASSQKPQCVIDAISEYYERDHANVHRAVHALSERATKAYEDARLKVQKFLGASCIREVIFTRGATEAINLVAHSFGRAFVHPGDEVVITAMEHHANIVPWQMLCEEKQADLRVVPITDAGELRLEELDKLLGPRTKILALGHVSNALGTINPVKEIIRLAHLRGIPVLIDGAQAAPHMPIDVRDLDCDFYAFSGHKVYGPTGIGALYGKAKHLEVMPPYQTGGDMIGYVSFEKTTWNELPYKFEAGTPDIAGAIGLGAAVEYLESIGRDLIAGHEKKLLDYATERLKAIAGVRIVGTARDKAGVISFLVEEPALAPVDVGTKLDLEGIAVRTGHHCCQPLMARYGIAGTARASFGLYNTLDEVDVFANALEKIVAEARPKATASTGPLTYAPTAAPSPDAAAEEVVEVFAFLDDWTDRYQHLMELGAKLPPMPDYLRTEENYVHGCQSTVYLDLRVRPGTRDIVEFLADSNAEIVRGLIGLLENLFSGQPARAVATFDVAGFFKRIGLDTNLSMGRRNGLAAMTERIQAFATKVVENL